VPTILNTAVAILGAVIWTVSVSIFLVGVFICVVIVRWQLPEILHSPLGILHHRLLLRRDLPLGLCPALAGEVARDGGFLDMVVAVRAVHGFGSIAAIRAKMASSSASCDSSVEMVGMGVMVGGGLDPDWVVLGFADFFRAIPSEQTVLACRSGGFHEQSTSHAAAEASADFHVAVAGGSLGLHPADYGVPVFFPVGFRCHSGGWLALACITGLFPFGFQGEELGGDCVESCAGCAGAVSFDAGLLGLESDESGLVFLGGAVGVGHAQLIP